MGETATEIPLAHRLRSIGISESYASQLVNGRRRPSLDLASRIERELGIPAISWVPAEKRSVERT